MKRRALLLLVLAGACTRPGAAEDAPGTYVLDLRGAADTLWLHRDGRYAHVYAARGAAPLASAGTWEFEVLMDRPSATLSRFPYRDPVTHAVHPGRPGTWPAFIERTLTGAVVLPVNPDVAVRYRRVSPRPVGSGGRAVLEQADPGR